MRKFKDWVTGKKEEVGEMLFQPLVRTEMLPENPYTLKNGEVIESSLATKIDLEAIIDIQEACYDGEAPWGRIAVNNELRNKRSSFFIMCHHGEQAIAFIGISRRNHSLHVTNIATIPEYQQLGIATFLIQTVIDIAKELGQKSITLEVRVSNETAKSLYRGIGFTDGRIKHNYYQNNGEAALDMIYRINETDEYHDKKTTK